MSWFRRRPKKVKPKQGDFRVMVWQDSINPEGWKAQVQEYWDYLDWQPIAITERQPTRDEACDLARAEAERLKRRFETLSEC